MATLHFSAYQFHQLTLKAARFLRLCGVCSESTLAQYMGFGVSDPFFLKLVRHLGKSHEFKRENKNYYATTQYSKARKTLKLAPRSFSLTEIPFLLQRSDFFVACYKQFPEAVLFPEQGGFQKRFNGKSIICDIEIPLFNFQIFCLEESLGQIDLDVICNYFRFIISSTYLQKNNLLFVVFGDNVSAIFLEQLNTILWKLYKELTGLASEESDWLYYQRLQVFKDDFLTRVLVDRSEPVVLHHPFSFATYHLPWIFDDGSFSKTDLIYRVIDYKDYIFFLNACEKLKTWKAGSKPSDFYELLRDGVSLSHLFPI